MTIMPNGQDKEKAATPDKRSAGALPRTISSPAALPDTSMADLNNAAAVKKNTRQTVLSGQKNPGDQVAEINLRPRFFIYRPIET
jgi:hypothetical protein